MTNHDTEPTNHARRIISQVCIFYSKVCIFYPLKYPLASNYLHFFLFWFIPSCLKLLWNSWTSNLSLVKVQDCWFLFMTTADVQAFERSDNGPKDMNSHMMLAETTQLYPWFHHHHLSQNSMPNHPFTDPTTPFHLDTHNKWHKLDHIPYSESFFSSWRTFPLKIKRCLSAGTFWGAKYIILYMTNHWTLFYIKYMNSLRKKPPRITYESYTNTMSLCFEWNNALRWQTLWRLTTSFAMCPLKSFTEL